jgi:hypothetical protein
MHDQGEEKKNYETINILTIDFQILGNLIIMRTVYRGYDTALIQYSSYRVFLCIDREKEIDRIKLY